MRIRSITLAFPIIVLAHSVAACSEPQINLADEECAIAMAALPERIKESESAATIEYVSDQIGPDQYTPSVASIVQKGFEDWDVDEDCAIKRDLEHCLQIVGRSELNPRNWSDQDDAGVVRSLGQCRHYDIGPEVTDKGWKELFGRPEIPTVTPFYLSTIRRIVVSKDRSRAIVTMEYFCGALCAEQYTLLLERRGEAWQVIGKQPHWIS